jgi:hypothetical protein
VKPTYVGHLIQRANIWKPLDTMKIELCIISCAKAGGQVGRQVHQVHNPVMNRNFKYCNQFLLENSNLFCMLVQKVWRLSGEQLVLLMNEDLGSFTVWQKNYTTHKLANIWRMNLYRKHNTEYETLAKIQDKHTQSFLGHPVPVKPAYTVSG